MSTSFPLLELSRKKPISMENAQNIEGYFKARCSYLVCKHSSVQPTAISKTAYATLSSRFEACLQQEMIQSLNKCEDNQDIDLIDLLNRLLKISDQARCLFIEINGFNKKHINNSGTGSQFLQYN